jgi:hypothetical protein
MTYKDKDIIRLARHWGATETYARMIFETIPEEQRTLEEPSQTPPQGTRCLIIVSCTQRNSK